MKFKSKRAIKLLIEKNLQRIGTKYMNLLKEFEKILKLYNFEYQ